MGIGESRFIGLSGLPQVCGQQVGVGHTPEPALPDRVYKPTIDVERKERIDAGLGTFR